jgi:mono/diheme cytochrome c family protein
MAGCGLLACVICCHAERRLSDAELGLTPTQADGRHIFDRQCGGCHEPYSSRPLKGPSLKGLFKRPYLQNGMPANDERVREICVYGRAKMPAFGRALTQAQIDELVAYLHTL